MICPYCGLGGVKDDGCTHMACGNCNGIWCYFCGKKNEELNKANQNGNIY